MIHHMQETKKKTKSFQQKIPKNIQKEKVLDKNKNKPNELKKLPVASTTATAAATAAALLEAEEDMDSPPLYQYESEDGLGSYEGIVDPGSPMRVKKASSSNKSMKNIVGAARAGGIGGGQDLSSSSSEPLTSLGAATDDDWVPKGRVGGRIRRIQGPDLHHVTKPSECISGIHYPPPVVRLPTNASGEKEKRI